MPHPNLFSPHRMGSVDLPNRIVMAPMTRGRAGPSFLANEVMAEYYAQRASSALIITEGTHTSPYARGWYHVPDVFEPAHAEAWKIVTKKVHEAGGRIYCQLWHTGRASHSNFRRGLPGFEGDLALAVAPSAIKRESHSGKQSYTNEEGEVDIETPRPLSEEEVDALPEEFRNAAQTAKDAGFDGVELHCANGYLLDEFLQSCSNKRTDKYGGSLENRFRVVDESLKAIFTVFEPDCVGVRLSPNGMFNGMGSDDFRESFLYYAERLSKLNLAYLHVMIGLGFGFHKKGDPMVMADFRKVYSGTLMANVGYDPESAEKEIAEGNTDLVSFGRLYISNPDLVERISKGVELAPSDFKTYYSSVGNVYTAEGYTDYKAMDATEYVS